MVAKRLAAAEWASDYLTETFLGKQIFKNVDFNPNRRDVTFQSH